MRKTIKEDKRFDKGEEPIENTKKLSKPHLEKGAFSRKI